MQFQIYTVSWAQNRIEDDTILKCLHGTFLNIFQMCPQVFWLHSLRVSPSLDLFAPRKPANFTPKHVTILKSMRFAVFDRLHD